MGIWRASGRACSTPRDHVAGGQHRVDQWRLSELLATEQIGVGAGDRFDHPRASGRCVATLLLCLGRIVGARPLAFRQQSHYRRRRRPATRVARPDRMLFRSIHGGSRPCLAGGATGQLGRTGQRLAAIRAFHRFPPRLAGPSPARPCPKATAGQCGSVLQPDGIYTPA